MKIKIIFSLFLLASLANAEFSKKQLRFQGGLGTSMMLDFSRLSTGFHKKISLMHNTFSSLHFGLKYFRTSYTPEDEKDEIFNSVSGQVTENGLVPIIRLMNPYLKENQFRFFAQIGYVFSSYHNELLFNNSIQKDVKRDLEGVEYTLGVNLDFSDNFSISTEGFFSPEEEGSQEDYYRIGTSLNLAYTFNTL